MLCRYRLGYVIDFTSFDSHVGRVSTMDYYHHGLRLTGGLTSCKWVCVAWVRSYAAWTLSYGTRTCTYGSSNYILYMLRHEASTVELCTCVWRMNWCFYLWPSALLSVDVLWWSMSNNNFTVWRRFWYITGCSEWPARIMLGTNAVLIYVDWCNCIYLTLSSEYNTLRVKIFSKL